MEMIQRQESSLLKRMAMLARTVAPRTGSRSNAPRTKNRKNAWDGRGRGGPRSMAGEVKELRDGQRPHDKGRGEGTERGVLGAPVDAELRQEKAPR